MGAGKHFVRRHAVVPLAVCPQGPAVRPDNHFRVFAGAFVERVCHGALELGSARPGGCDDFAAIIHNGVNQHGAHLMRPRGDVGDLLFEAVNVAHVCAPLSGLRFWPHTGGWSQSDNGAKTEYTVFNADMVYLGERIKKSPAGWSGIECGRLGIPGYTNTT
jgi:hypothetical protein